jgi:peptidoglycan/LPS O-acetylase OafA/YrhL
VQLGGGARAFGAWIDLFRWSAALAVLWTHAGLKMLKPVQDAAYLSPGHVSPARAAYAFVAGFDHYAVLVFFVLSGYLVGGSLLQRFAASGRVEFGTYLVKRLLRLGLVLWPAYLLILVADRIGILFGGIELGLYTPDVTKALALPSLACNALYLQTALCVQYGENGALWSLFNEAWYYVLFPPLLLGIAGKLPLATRAGLILLALAALALLTRIQFDGAALGPYMATWLLGVAVAGRRTPLVRSVRLASALFVLAMLAIRLGVRASFARHHPVGVFGLDLFASLLFANMLLSMRHAPGLRAPPGRAALHRALAGFSFSNYCVHIPVLYCYIAVAAWYTGRGAAMAGSDGLDWLVVLGGLVTCVTSAFLFSRVTEAHTDRVRDWLLPAAAQPRRA